MGTPGSEPRRGPLSFLRPRTGLDLFLIVAMAALFIAWAYSRFRDQADKRVFVPPETIDHDLVRIHRTAEEEIATKIVERWKVRGRTESVAAVYEFYVFPYKPVFFLGAAKEGGLDRKKILEEEMHIFEGRPGPSDKIIESHKDGIAFLCASFQRGTGLVALSAVCVWDDGDSTGFGIRIAGGDLNDTLKYTAEARKRLLSPPAASLPFPEERAPAPPQKESEIHRTTRDIVASLLGYNCARFTTFLPQGSPEMFRERIRDDILNTMQDPVEKVCFVLSILKFPRAETMLIRPRTLSTDRAVLLLTSKDKGDRAVEVRLLKTNDGWKIDPDWALKQVQDYPVKMTLLQYAMNLQGREHYSDRPQSRNAERGMAHLHSETNKVYLQLASNQQAICASSLSESGELFLIHLDADKQVSYKRASTLPAQCPAQAFDTAW